MPRYDYVCEDGHAFELKQKFSDEPGADCPVCGKPSTRQFSVVPIVFKGSGWYVNDYGKKGAGAASSYGEEGSDGESSKSDGSDKSGSSKAKDGAKSEKAPSTPSKEKAGSKSGD